MTTEVCAVFETGFVVVSKYWDWMASRMLHDVSVNTQQDSVLLGCDRVIGCTVPMLCSSIVYSSSRSVSPWLLVFCECMFDIVCCCTVLPEWNVHSCTQFVMFVLRLDSLLKAQPKPSIYCHIETIFGYLYRYGCLGNNSEVKTW